MADVKESLKNFKERLPEPLSTYEFTTHIWVSLAIGLLTIVLVLYYVLRTKKVKVPVLGNIVGPPKPRFRKRDKVMFYGRKMLRKVKIFTRNTIRDASVTPGTRSRTSKKRQLVFKIAKRLLRFKKDRTPQLRRREPPPSLLEVDLKQQQHQEHRLPPEVMYMLESVRVLGHFEKPIFLELCKYIETRFVPAGEYVFRIGDRDDSIYVVRSGKVDVYINDADGTPHIMKQVLQGDTIHSLLSILDLLTGHPSPYKTVEAIAVVDTTILRLPAQAFQIILERYPESLVRVVQVIMVRLQRVTFMALHHYLGLSWELMKSENLSDPAYLIHSLHIPPKSPDKKHRQGSVETEHMLRFINNDSETGKNTRSMSLNTGLEDTKLTSDFAAACSRARVATDNSGLPAPDAKLMQDVAGGDGEVPLSGHIMLTSQTIAAAQSSLADQTSGQTPMQPATGPHAPPKRQSSRRAIISDNISIIPDATSSVRAVDNKEVLAMATQDLVTLLGLENKSLLVGKVVLRYISAGKELIRQGDQDAMLIFVVTGTLQVLQQVVGKETQERSLFVVNPGEIVGSLAVLTGEPSFFTTRSRTDAHICTISKLDFYGLMKEQPNIVLNVAHTVVKRMSAFVRQIDFALDWRRIEAGRAVFRQGEPSDCIYIVLNGRLRSVVTQKNGTKELVGEYGRGELVGIVEVLTQNERATTMMAVRDTEVAVLPEELLNMIKRKYPQVVTRLIHLLGQRILGTLKNRPIVESPLSEHPNVEPRPAVANLATVAIMPISFDVPLSNFVMELQLATGAIGPTLRLTCDTILSKLGNAAFDAVNEYRLLSWLGQQEDIHRMVLYQCDKSMTPWTQHCIRQADCILIVGLSESEPTVGQIEKQMENLAVRAQKELVLLHKEDTITPIGTIDWLNARAWCSSHHHVRCPKRVFSRKPHHQMVEIYQKLIVLQRPDRQSDFSRLARFLTGTSVGLVLGGGGARGIAHVGMMKAMQEVGIPIDMVAGTSIGSFIGGIWAEERNLTRCTQRAREWSIDMNKMWKKLLDLTYPITAIFSGVSFNHSIETVFHNRQIEDLWIPYACVTTDISASKMRVHTSGSLWRYVRASMSLSGYLPPLCDPVDGHLLLDGGYVNNVPADVLKTMGAQTIFAIDVGSEDTTQLTNYGDQLSGWSLLWNRWNPWASEIRVPNMAEVQSRLAYVSCMRQLEQVKKARYCEYIRPPIDRYQTLQFGAFDEIFDVGYNHGKTLFSSWEKAHLLEQIFKEKDENTTKPMLHQTTVPREADFTDLAELISRIDDPLEDPVLPVLSDDEYEDYYDEDDDDNASFTSEPAVESLSSLEPSRHRTVSEGASPSTTPTEERSPAPMRRLMLPSSKRLAEDDEDADDECFIPNIRRTSKTKITEPNKEKNIASPSS